MEEKKYAIEDVIAEASEFLNRKKKRNEITYKNYRTTLKYFIYYLNNIAKVNSLDSSNKDVLLEGFQGSLLEGFNYKTSESESIVKVKPSSVNTHIRRTKTFLNSLGLSVDKVKALDVNKPKYKSLKPEEIRLLIDECSNKWTNKEIAVRNATLINFLFNTAFRINEALNIKTHDFYKEDGSYYVRIHEKGKAKGILTPIAISENTAELLRSYIKIKSVPSDYIFSSTKSSKSGKANKLNRENFNKYIISLAEYVDLKHHTNIYSIVKNNSSHVFRHSKATYLLNVKKEDVVTVKEVLRHKSIDSTLIYLNPEEEKINSVRINNDL